MCRPRRQEGKSQAAVVPAFMDLSLLLGYTVIENNINNCTYRESDHENSRCSKF